MIRKQIAQDDIFAMMEVGGFIYTNRLDQFGT